MRTVHWQTPPNVINLARRRRARAPADASERTRRHVLAQLELMRCMLEGGSLVEGTHEHAYVMARLCGLRRIVEAWAARLR